MSFCLIFECKRLCRAHLLKISCLFSILLVIFLDIPGEASVVLEPIIVEKSIGFDYSPDYFSEITYSDLNGSGDAVSVLDSLSSLDLRARGKFGIQGDLSIRANNFEDNDVLINGISVKDPQTGHFSLSIPFSIADLEKVVIKENLNSVNFILKEPKSEGGLIRAFYGEHALSGQTLSVNFPLDSINNRISLSRQESKGARPDTDFELNNFSLHSLWKEQSKRIELLYGFAKKDFGADGFYAWPVYTQEEEHIDNRFFLVKAIEQISTVSLEITPFYRRYQDKFILDRKNPDFYTNYHTNYVYGFNNTVDFLDYPFSLEFGLRKEKITSTNLGRHSRKEETIKFIMKERDIFRNLTLKGWIKGGYLSGSDWVNAFYFEPRYNINDSLAFSLSMNRVYRKPSFTELYYLSPANQGNADLDVQTACNYQSNLTYTGSDFVSGIKIFYRDQHDTIDWVKQESHLPWQAENIGGLEAAGITYNISWGLKGNYLRKLDLGYTFVSLNKDNAYNYSKYNFNHLNHKLSLISRLSLNKVIEVYPSFNLEKPVNESCRVIAGLRIIFTPRQGFTFFIQGDNIFGQGYAYYPGVKAPGSWWRTGIEYAF